MRALLLGLFLAVGTVVVAQERPTDLTQVSLEDLLNMPVTSVAKREQTLWRTASAIFVISAEDIRRSGATRIPDLLRMVPGVDVAQINANTWAISVRGFNGRFSNALLVMVDGRTAYTPSFGGVFWDVLDMPLENIERIEVIRGPGGSVWGANAVNGIINIVTRKASATQGIMVVAGVGNLDAGFGTVEYGGRLGKDTDYRVYVRYFNQNHMPGLSGADGADSWHALRGGFRLDSSLSAKDKLTFQGDLYGGQEGVPTAMLASITSPAPQNVDTQVELRGGFVQSIWNHSFSARSETMLQASFDRYARNDVLDEDRNTLNLDFQHHLAWDRRQDVVWGGSYRYSTADSHGGLTFSLDPANLSTQLFSGFIQDEIALLPERLYVTAGVKLEHNHYTGFNLMPSVRVAWTPGQHYMLWAAISHAARTPTSVDTAGRAIFGGFPGPGGTPAVAALVGNPDFQDEHLMAYEMGCRTTVLQHLSIDVATYYNHYTHQQTLEPGAPFFENTPAPPHFVFPVSYQNLRYGESHGLEIAANWKISSRWMLAPGYSFERIHMHLDASSQDTGSVADAEGSSPRQGAQLRSHLDFPHHIAWDASAYFVDRLQNAGIPSSTRLDTGLTWHWRESLSWSLVGQNLLGDHHLEFTDGTGSVRSTLVKRSGYVKLTWRF